MQLGSWLPDCRILPFHPAPSRAQVSGAENGAWPSQSLLARNDHLYVQPSLVCTGRAQTAFQPLLSGVVMGLALGSPETESRTCCTRCSVLRRRWEPHLPMPKASHKQENPC